MRDAPCRYGAVYVKVKITSRINVTNGADSRERIPVRLVTPAAEVLSWCFADVPMHSLCDPWRTQDIGFLAMARSRAIPTPRGPQATRARVPPDGRAVSRSRQDQRISWARKQCPDTDDETRRWGRLERQRLQAPAGWSSGQTSCASGCDRAAAARPGLRLDSVQHELAPWLVPTRRKVL